MSRPKSDADLKRARWKAYCKALYAGQAVGPIPEDLHDLTCGAKTRKGTPCKRRDLYSSGRCKLHGGLSTGPKTAEGKARVGRKRAYEVGKDKTRVTEVRSEEVRSDAGGWRTVAKPASEPKRWRIVKTP